MSFERLAGILLHPTSLPSRNGIGDLGPEAYKFIDFLAAARLGLWQILPLSPPGLGNSPYSAISAFAGNPLLISLDRLADRGWIERERLKPSAAVFPSTFVHHFFVTRSTHACPLGLIVQSFRHRAARGLQCRPSQKPHITIPCTFGRLNSAVMKSRR